MSDKKIRFMVTAAVMAALTYVATTVVRIPAPTGGYVHMGDGLVLLCGWILGPWWGGAAAGIGSMLVDLLGGYMSFVPGTLVIKFLDAMAAALAACITRGDPLRECARQAVGAGALACTSEETIHSGMSWENINYILNKEEL